MEDNQVFNQMGIELEENNKAKVENIIEYEINNSAENTLAFFANAALFIGIAASVICIPTICFVEQKGYYSHRVEFNPAGFGITVGILVSSLITWAFMKVFVNISKTLKGINKRLEARGTE